MYRRCIAVDVNICKHCEYFRSQQSVCQFLAEFSSLMAVGQKMVAALLRQRDLNKTSREDSGLPVILLCPVRCWASSEPDRDAVRQQSPNGAMIEGHQQLLRQVVFPEDPQEEQPLLCLLHCCSGVIHPGEVLSDVAAHGGAKEPEDWDSFQRSPRWCRVDWGLLCRAERLIAFAIKSRYDKMRICSRNVRDYNVRKRVGHWAASKFHAAL